VAFCLVALLNSDNVPHKNLFQTTVFVVIIFTVFVQVRLFISLLLWHLYVAYHFFSGCILLTLHILLFHVPRQNLVKEPSQLLV